MTENVRIAGLFDLEHTIACELFDGKTYPWEVLPEIADFIRKLGSELDPEMYDHPAEDTWIAKNAKIAPTACLNGPLIVDCEAEIRHCAFVRGSAIIGRNAVVGNSTELKNCVLFDGVQVPHYNYVGDSVLGYKAHMGAGSITSNVKSDKKDIIIHVDEEIETDMRKIGAMIGDRAEIGCNSVLNPGTIIGRNAIVYPLSSVRGTVPENHIYKGEDRIVARKQEQ